MHGSAGDLLLTLQLFQASPMRGSIAMLLEPGLIPVAAGNLALHLLQVGGHSIKYMLAKDKNWTKALKYMLVDLKFCLKFMISLDKQGPPVVALQREDPAALRP